MKQSAAIQIGWTELPVKEARNQHRRKGDEHGEKELKSQIGWTELKSGTPQPILPWCTKRRRAGYFAAKRRRYLGVSARRRRKLERTSGGLHRSGAEKAL
jgi:hypothetical protein